MNRALKIGGFVLVTLFGAYGCTKAPGGSDSSTSPAAKLQRLEEDLKAVSTARDDFRQKLLAAEERQAKLQKQLDTERAELKARTSERDTIATQYEGFRKNLKDLLGQAESALANPTGSLSSTSVGADVAPMPSAAGSGVRD
jgi:septal ring factor EnvC (AmiA/AmiB activator)